MFNKPIKSKLLIASIIFVTGCAGTKLHVQQGYSSNQADSFSYTIVDNANVTNEGMSIFKNRLDSQFNQFGLLNTNSNKVVEITFSNYYMRHGAARALVGLMAGADNITSNVTIKDKSNGTVAGTFQVISKNPTAHGSSKSLIEQHADKIATYIKSGKS